MASIQPLPLGIVRAGWADQVAAPPHDALTPAQRRRHLEQYPLSYLGVTRAPEDAGPERSSTDELLADGLAQLDRLLDSDVFAFGHEARFHLYRLDDHNHSQTGVVCGVAVDDYDTGVVRIHERIKSDRAHHLARHLRTVGAQSSPIALGATVSSGLEALLDHPPDLAPVLDLTTDDGLRQRVWPVTDPDVVERIQSELSAAALYLIDGHHRAAAASAYRQGGTASLGSAFDWMLSAIFPLSRLHNKAFHRVVHGIGDADRFQDRLTELFPTRLVDSVTELDQRVDTEIVACIDGGRWLLIDLPFSPASERLNEAATMIANLDMVRLGTHVLGPLLAIDESSPGGALSYLPGLADTNAIAAIDPEPDDVVFVMRAVTMDQLIVASDAGLVMPPKSTYFEPKVRSGVFLHRKY